MTNLTTLGLHLSKLYLLDRSIDHYSGKLLSHDRIHSLQLSPNVNKKLQCNGESQ